MVLKIGVFVNYATGSIVYLTAGAFVINIIEPTVKALFRYSVMTADLYKMEYTRIYKSISGVLPNIENIHYFFDGINSFFITGTIFGSIWLLVHCFNFIFKHYCHLQNRYGGAF